MNIALERGYPTPFANSPLLPLLLLTLTKQRHCPKPSATFHEEYDYVVVGAGPAGAVVASRLSEQKCVTVALLEAGRSPPVLTEIPSIGRSFFYTDIDWNYKTEPQQHTAKFLVDKKVPWPSGKAVGGSSVLNAMVYSRGNQKNYDDWASQGAEGWSSKDVWPYFLKLENNTDPKYLNNGYHSSHGPMSIQKPKDEPQIKKSILKAINESGFQMIDPNGNGQTGFYDFQAFLRDGQRCSSAKAYLVPPESRTNLHIITGAHVRKVKFEGNEAKGVEFDKGNNTHTVKAKREVILAAGAVNTPQILMLSGIGPRKHLEELEIPVVADLPVGNNLQDHVSVPLIYQLNHTDKTTVERIKELGNVQEYILHRTGPLAAAQHILVVGFVGDESTTSVEKLPISELYLAELTTLLTKQLNIKPEVYDQVYRPYDNQTLMVCTVNAVQPKSKGTIRLRSNDPYDPPMIDPNYFDDQQDITDTVKGLQVCHKICTRESMKKVGTRPLETPVPGCEELRSHKNRFYECMARSIVQTMSHPVGTAKMGNPSDPTTVVDPQLKVKGVNGLRVVDASVMPIIPSGDLEAPTLMVAEKAADIIKETVDCSAEETQNSIHGAIFES